MNKSCLRATHNTRVSGVRYIAEVGGIANPSLAIHRSDHPFTSMGEVSLVAPIEMVDPADSQVEVYDTDIYSGRTPERLFKTTKATHALEADLWREARRLEGEQAFVSGSDHLLKGKDPAETAYHLSRSAAGISLFLEDRGVTTDPVMGRPQFRSAVFETDEVQSFLRSFDGEWVDFQYGDETHRRYSEAVRRGVLAQFTPILGAEQAEELLDEYLNKEGLASFNRVDHIRSDLRMQEQGSALDIEATRRSVEALVAGHGGPEAVEDYWRERVRQTYGPAYFLGRRGRKKEYTLDNVSREMLLDQDPRGKEKGMIFFPGQSRAASARRFRSLEEISLFHDRLVTAEEIDAAKKGQDEFRTGLAGELMRHHPSAQNANEFRAMWDTLDDMHEVIADFGSRQPRDITSLRQSLRKKGFLPVPDSLAGKLLEYATMLIEFTPAQYLEVKVQRPVMLREFVGAIVPEDTPDDVIRILDDAGIKIATYPRHDHAARAAAFETLCARTPGIAEKARLSTPATPEQKTSARRI